MTIIEALNRLMAKQSLSRDEAREIMGQLMQGALTPVQISAFLSALRTKGETVAEISGAAEAMREAALPVQSATDVLVDTCGTGGDGSGCFNISTAAAFVVAGAGFPVAKHGNRSVSSKCGSADVLEAAGVGIQVQPEEAEACLRKAGITFLFAPAFHPATRHAMPVRKELGVRTVFNLLGPLTNPARPNVQLVGVYDAAWVRPIAEVLVSLGCREGAVVHGQGHDELSITGPTRVAEIEDCRIIEHEWRPEDFGIRSAPLETLQGGDGVFNAKILLSVLSGEQSAYRDAVCLNAAAAIRAATRLRSGERQQLSLQDAYQVAVDSVTSGKAKARFEALKQMTAKRMVSNG